ncbi:MAG: hypothetical protein LUC93_07190 [Planctomycetaceae bacterium]|nr:hypothetical protein [Planctomycetaceae bacterium]
MITARRMAIGCILIVGLFAARAAAGDAMDLLRAREGSRRGYVDLYYRYAPLQRILFDLENLKPGVTLSVKADNATDRQDLLAEPLSVGPLAGVPWDDAVRYVAEAVRLTVDTSAEAEGVIVLEKTTRFTGVFDGVRLGEAIRLIAERGFADVVVSPTVDADQPVHLTFADVPWRDALRSVLAAHGCTMETDMSGVVRVITREESLAQTGTVTRPLRYLNPNDPDNRRIEGRFESLMETLAGMSPDHGPASTIVYEHESNSLLLTADPETLEAMLSLVDMLDQPPYQVILEASVVTMDMDPADFLQADWVVRDAVTTEATEVWEPVCAIHGANCPTLAALPEPLPSSYSVGTVSTGDAAAVVDASLNGGAATVTQAPQMTVVDRETALVSIGSVKTEPVQTAGKGGLPAYSYLERFSGIRLTMVPRVCGDGDQVMLDVVYEQCGEVPSPGCRPVFDSRPTTIRTTMMLHSGETGVIAGVVEKGVPDNSGWRKPFRQTTASARGRHSVILLTPVVIAPPGGGEFEEGVEALRAALAQAE